MSGDALVGFRDPYGVRPLCLGDYDGHPVISSETAGPRHHRRPLRARDRARRDRHRRQEHGLRSERVELEGARPALCIFEFIYFARPDSVMNGQTLHVVRQEMGRHLALEAPVEADLVIPVPDTGMPAAIGYAAASGIPYVEGLIKNRYVHRTFIQPDDHLRQVGIRMKLNPLTLGDQGQAPGGRRRLDRARQHHAPARGDAVRAPGPRRCTCASARRRSSGPASTASTWRPATSSSPPTDAWTRSAPVGATSLHYLTLEGLQDSTGLPRSQFCRACFDGDYPIAVPEEYAMCKMRFEKDAAAAACDP